jgi:hypothetical protein
MASAMATPLTWLLLLIWTEPSVAELPVLKWYVPR